MKRNDWINKSSLHTFCTVRTGKNTFIQAVFPKTLLLVTLLLLNAFVTWSQNDGRSRTLILLPDINIVASDADHKYTGDDLSLYGTKKGPARVRNHAVFMHFNLSYIPAGALVDEVDLALYPKEKKEGELQTVQVYELKSRWPEPPAPNMEIKDPAIGKEDITDGEINTSVHFSLNIGGTSWAANRNGNYWLVITANAQHFLYYSSRSKDTARQPKLIVKYHMPDQFQSGNWAQHKYNAQHTGMLEWKSNAVPMNYNGKTILNASNFYIRSSPVYCNNELVFYSTNQDSTLHRMKACNENGTVLAENTDIGGIVNYGPVADRNDNVYCVVKGTTIKMLDVKNGLKTVDTKTLADGANVIAKPVIGFDGSLYLSTDKGLYAYTPFPEFKVKWVYRANGRKLGTAALRGDEKMVYVYDGGEKGTSGGGRLVAINNINGRERWNKAGLPTFEKETPVPAASYPYVCLTDGIITGKMFYIIQDEDTAGRQVKAVQGDRISPPALSKDKAFIIQNTRLWCYYLYNNGTAGFGETELNAASALVMDKDMNAYVLSVKEGDQYLARLVSPFKTSLPVLKFKIPSEVGNLKDNALLLTPTGKLFTWNDNLLYAISPTSVSEGNAISVPVDDAEIKSEYQYRSEKKVTVKDGTTISSIKNVVIYSRAGGVGFGKNIKVEKGAQLRVLVQ